MKKSRKSKIYLALSILCIITLIVICFIFPLPNSFGFNFFRFLIVLSGVVLFKWYVLQSNYDETIYNANKDISRLKEKYDYINMVVSDNSKLIYDSLSSDLIKKYDISIDKFDDYLLDLEANIKEFETQAGGESKTSNLYIIIASIMNSLISAWKIKSSIPKEISSPNELIELNCKLAVCVALTICDLSYEELKDNSYIKRLISLLEISYRDNQYGKISIIEHEAMILELLQNMD